jgi:hypothetical protein
VFVAHRTEPQGHLKADLTIRVRRELPYAFLNPFSRMPFADHHALAPDLGVGIGQELEA